MIFTTVDMTEEDTLVRLEERLKAHTDRFTEVLQTVTALAHQTAILDQRLKANESETTAFREAKHNINKFLHVYEYQMDGVAKALSGLTASAEKNKSAVEYQLSLLQENIISIQHWKYTVLGGCAAIGTVGGILSTLLAKYIG